MARQSIQQRKAALQEQLALLEKEEQEIANKRQVIIGRICEKLMQNDPTIKNTIDTALASQVTKATEREILGLPKLCSDSRH